MREITRMGTNVLHTLAAAALIVAIQFLVMNTVEDWRWRLAVLAVPALFAGASVARLLADHAVVSMRRGGGR